MRLKVRAAKDDAVGWISKKESSVKQWKALYRCQDKVALQDSKAVEGAKDIKQLNKGDMLEVLEGPVADGKVMRIKMALKDGTSGWATLKNEAGRRLFEC